MAQRPGRPLANLTSSWNSVAQHSPRSAERDLGPEPSERGARRSRSRRRAAGRRELPYAPLAERGALALFVATVIGSVLAIGTVHTTSLLIVAVCAFGAAALGAYAHAASPATAGRVALSMPVITCIALAAYTLLQSIPLPLGLLRAIAPANADVWERVLLPFGEPAVRWASISLDPGASVVEALKWAVYGAVFAAAAALSSRRGATYGIAVVFTAAVFAALTTVGHGLVGVSRVFGVYQPAFAVSPWHVGPLLNPNNLAGYLNLGAIAGLGLILTRRPILPVWLVGLGVMLTVGVEVTSASRGGVLALPIGVVALALVARARSQLSGARARASTWLIALAVGGGAVLAALGGTRETWDELYQKDLAKIGMLVWAKPLISDHPWFGVGRGAFESVFPVYRVSPGNIVFTHAENFPAQWAAEWGLPVALAALFAFGWAFFPRRLGVHRSATAAGGWIGVFVLLVQNLFDLALEVPAVCIAIMAVMGSLWGDGGRRRAAPEPSTGPDPKPEAQARGAAGIGLVGAALILIAAPVRSTDVAADRASIRASYERRNVQFPEEASALRVELRAAMLRHPAEPYFPLVGALTAVRAHDQSPLPWLQHTLERGHVNGRAHLLLAEVLHALGAKGQALFELRLSVENDGGLATAAAALVTRWTRAVDEILAAAPEGKAGGPMLDLVAATLFSPDGWELSERVNREVMARDPYAVSARSRAAELRLRALADGPRGPMPADVICPDREACRREVLEQAAAIGRAAPDLSIAALLRARLLLIDGKAPEALRLLTLECEKATDRVPCLQLRVKAAAEIKGEDDITAASRELLAAACADLARCADIANWIGDLRTARSEPSLALPLYERAARVDPTDQRWLKLADAASRAGSHLRSADALQQIARRRGGDAEIARRIEEEQRRAALPLP
jgi:O-Antigen ligase